LDENPNPQLHQAFRAANNDYYEFLITWWDNIQRYLPPSAARTRDARATEMFAPRLARPDLDRTQFSHLDNLNFSMPLEEHFVTKDGLSFGFYMTADSQAASREVRNKSKRLAKT
jgi:hypothetical protein